ncbi:MAG: MSEP-CTERM sorting domain-containing protein [Verrucomicrobiota bacterium]
MRPGQQNLTAPLPPERTIPPPLPRQRSVSWVLPPSALSPWLILAVGVIPQAVLLHLNRQAWDLAGGEMNPSQRLTAYSIFSLEMLSLLASAGLAAWLFATKSSFTRLQGILPLVVGPAFLSAAFTLSSQAIPAALADWMLPPERWILQQFALAVPMVLFGALRLLCPDQQEDAAPSGAWMRPILMAALLIGASYGYIFAAAFTGALFAGNSHGHFVGVLVCAGYIGLSLIATAAAMRVCIDLYLCARARSVIFLGILCFAIALSAPLAGLALNSWIPFPSDFQVPAIYAMAVLNGLVVLLPNFASIFWQRTTWILQCLFFPFTVYFFAVFLPFLPLASLGMLFFGLGLLVYVPSLLFLLHGYRLIDGFLLAVRDGKRVIALAAGIAAILAWPVGYTVSARMDRANLHGALDYLQYPDYGQDANFPGNLGSLRSALLNLRDFKEGLYMPYLSEYYNWIVFDGMVLPQSRLNATYEAFFGEGIPKSTLKPMMGMLGSRNARSVSEVLNGPAGQRPTCDAIARKTEIKTATDAGISRSRLAMTVFNPTSVATEYATRIEVPPGVLITGLSLTIGNDNVAGKLFEKRAATWVYQKITETRPVPKDPAILKFLGPHSAELRVYPVAPGESRHVEVELTYPEGWRPVIRTGSETLVPEPGASPMPLIAVGGNGYFSVLLPESLAVGLPALKREPYLHLLVDSSKDSLFQDARSLNNAMTVVARSFPAVKIARISFVNFETRPFQDSGLVALEELENPAIPQAVAGRFRGGFLPDRAIKEVLWQHQLEMAAGKPDALRSFPQIVVLRGTSHEVQPDQNLSEFARLLPDLPGYWTLGPDARHPDFTDFNGNPKEPAQVPVTVYRAGKECFAAAAGQAVSHAGISPGPPVPPIIEVFQPDTGTFAPLPSGAAGSAPQSYARALLPWNLELARIFEPSRNTGNEPLKRLITLCRSTGTLVPSLAYMVVEDTAQWKMLERTEKKTLNGHEALALSDATPEPGTIALFLVGVAVLFTIFRLRKSAARRRM